MRYCCLIVILVLVIFIFNGCTAKQEYENDLKSAELKINELQKQVDELKGDLEKQKLTSTTQNDYIDSNLSLRIVGVDDRSLRYILTSPKRNAQSVSIVGSKIEELVEDYEEIEWKSDNSGSFFKVEVIGSIFDFQLIHINWNEESNELLEVEVVNELKELRNKTLYIENVLPCGIPTHKIKWKDQNGKEYELYLSNDGYGFNGTVLWSR